MEAADKTDSPVIVQASAGARKYAGAPFLRHLILAAVEEFPHIPVCMHQDHGTSPAVCQRSIQLGFSSVMMDGSLGEDGKTPMDYDYNVRVTQDAVAMAHACGVSVEGELGCLGSLETGKDADIIVCDGDLFDYRTFVQWAVVNGKVVYDKATAPYFAHIRPRESQD